MKLLVSIPQPEGWSKRDVANYVKDAVRMWSKGQHPEDPMWDASDKTTVKIVQEGLPDGR